LPVAKISHSEYSNDNDILQFIFKKKNKRSNLNIMHRNLSLSGAEARLIFSSFFYQRYLAMSKLIA
jgi:hypothetical protein